MDEHGTKRRDFLKLGARDRCGSGLGARGHETRRVVGGNSCD